MTRPRHDLLCPLDGECICDLLAKARAAERDYILNVAADTLKNHQVTDGVCLCLANVKDEDQHHDDLIRHYVKTALPSP